MEQQVEQFICCFSYYDYRRHKHYFTITERNKKLIITFEEKIIMTWNQKERSIQ